MECKGSGVTMYDHGAISFWISILCCATIIR